MWAAIISFLITLFTSLKDKAKETCSTLWTAAKDAGGGMIDSAVDWFKDPEVSFQTKAAAVLAGGFVLAPKTTQSAVDNVIQGVGDTIGTGLDVVDDVVDQVADSSWIKWVLLAAVGFVLLKK